MMLTHMQLLGTQPEKRAAKAEGKLSRQKNNPSRYANEALTKEKLKEFISEELTDYYGTESSYDLPKRQKKTGASESPLDKSERDFIDAAIRKKFKTLEYKEGKLLKQKLKKIIDDVVAAELESFSPATLAEKKWGKAQGRDYSKEPKTAGNSKNIQRKRDRRKAEREGRVSKGDGKDVHHPKGYSNGSPTKVMPTSSNRGMSGEGGRKKEPKK